MGNTFSSAALWAPEDNGQRLLRYSSTNELIMNRIKNFVDSLSAQEARTPFHQPLTWVTELKCADMIIDLHKEGSNLVSEMKDEKGEPLLLFCARGALTEVCARNFEVIQKFLNAAGFKQLTEIRRCIEMNPNLMDCIFGDVFSALRLTGLSADQIAFRTSMYGLYIRMLNLDKELDKINEDLLEDDGMGQIMLTVEKTNTEEVIGGPSTASIESVDETRNDSTDAPLAKKSRIESTAAAAQSEDNVDDQQDSDGDEESDKSGDESSSDGGGEEQATEDAARLATDDQQDEKTNVKRLVISVLEFLSNQQQSLDLSDAAKQSVELAAQCLESAYDVRLQDSNAVALYPLPASLPVIFSAGLDQFDATQCQDLEHAAEILQLQGDMMIQLSKPDKAFDCFTASLSLDCSNTGLLWKRSELFKDSGEHEKCINDCLDIVKLDPTNGEAFNRIGLCCLALSKFEEARDYFKKALNQDTINEHFWKNLRDVEQKILSRPLTAEVLAEVPPEQQKELIRQRMLPLVSVIAPNSASEVVQLLMALDNLTLLQLLQSTESLKAKVELAMQLLQKEPSGQ